MIGVHLRKKEFPMEELNRCHWYFGLIACSHTDEIIGKSSPVVPLMETSTQDESGVSCGLISTVLALASAAIRHRFAAGSTTLLVSKDMNSPQPSAARQALVRTASGRASPNQTTPGRRVSLPPRTPPAAVPGPDGRGSAHSRHSCDAVRRTNTASRISLGCPESIFL